MATRRYLKDKACTRCHKTKPMKQFWQDKRRFDGRCAYCIDCGKAYHKKRRIDNPEKERFFARRRYRLNRDGERERQLVRKYGITFADYERMLKQQKGKCSICKRKQAKTYDVDHCHVTKKVRGLLCATCNRMLGLGRDSIQIFMAAVAYLQKHGVAA